ncbi:MAG: LrgB family protein [Thermoguttaceae bacterium]
MTHLWESIAPIFRENGYFGLTMTVGGYLLSLVLQKKYKSPFFNPVLIALCLTLVGLKLFSIDYESYALDALPLTYLITPATVCLAVPLYRQFETVKRNWLAILAACCVGTIVNMILVWIVARAFQMEYEEYITFLSKSITMAIGVGITEEYGGYVAITCAVITIAGITGNMSGVYFLKKCGIVNPAAQGLAIGSTSHAFGTAKALEIGETQGAFSGLAIALTGVLTVLMAPLASILPL